MNTTKQLAKHLRELYFGANWTCVNFKDTLADISWQEAITKHQNFNIGITDVSHEGNYYFITQVIKKL